ISRLRIIVAGVDVLESADNLLTLNEWQHVAGLWDGDSLKLFRNGIQVASSSYTGPGIPEPSDKPLRIGTETPTWQNFDGLIDEVKIYRGALSTAEIMDEVKMTMRGYWKFDESSGSIAYDSSGYGNDGILTNGPARVTGIQRGALQFDGLDDYVNCGDDASLDITGDMSVLTWVKFNQIPADNAALVSKNEGAYANYKWVFAYVGSFAGLSHQLGVHVNDPTAPDIWLSSSTWTPEINKWYHVAVVKSGDEFRFYVDGDSRGQDWSSHPFPSVSAPLIIARAEGSFHLNGALDEVILYGRALSEQEIWYAYLEGRCGDANGDDMVNILDVTYIINYLYKNGPAPEPMDAADADASGSINLLDVTHIINYLYKMGDPPTCM
ncbi:MAG: hypothetical protein JSU69_11305, partial [Candidatus Zixiibacteriota bacterium]